MKRRLSHYQAGQAVNGAAAPLDPLLAQKADRRRRIKDRFKLHPQVHMGRYVVCVCVSVVCVCVVCIV
jgi:hypothetical protein